MNSKYKVLASNTAIFAIGNILVKMISFFLLPLYTSILTKSQYGVAELLNNNIEIVLPIMSLCIIEALYRFSIDEDADHNKLFVNSIVIIILGDIIVAIACLVWHYTFNYQYAFYFMLLYITTTFYKLTTQFARGKGHVKRYVLYGIINSLILVAANFVFLVKLRWGISAYLLSFSIGYGVSAVIAFFMSKEYKHIKFKYFDLKNLKEMLAYSMPSIPNMLSWWVNSLSDRYIVKCFCGDAAAGLYTAASKLPALVNLVTSIFQQAWQYSTAVEIGDGNSKEFFSKVFKLYSYFCFLIGTGLILFNKLICLILLKADFYEAWVFVPLLLLSAVFNCIGTYFGTFYNAIKNNRMLMFSTLLGAMVNIVLNFALIPNMGGMGAAIATAISYFVVMLVRMINISKIVEIDININKFILQISVLVISAILALFSGILYSIVIFVLLSILFISDYFIPLEIFKFIIKKLRRNK